MQKLTLETRRIETGVLLFLFLLGLFLAFYSSLPVLTEESSFWRNDEGYFIILGRSNGLLINLRYGLFASIVKPFLALFSDYHAVVAYKSTVLLASLPVFRRILSEFGVKIFCLAALIFLYLNLFFLRESLIFLISITTLVVLSHASWRVGSRVLAGLGILVLFRPQAVLLYVRPWVSLAAAYTFLVYFRSIYAERQMPDTPHLLLADYWLEVIKYVAISLNGLNPITKLGHYFRREMYVEYMLLFAASMALLMVFLQASLSCVSEKFSFPHRARFGSGLLMMLILYGGLGMSADSRILLSTAGAFVLFVAEGLIRPKYLFGLLGGLLLAVLLKPLFTDVLLLPAVSQLRP